MPIGAIVGTAADIYLDHRNYKRQLEQRDWDKQWQIDQMNIQRQWANEDWTRQNEYDSHLQNRKRLEQAGLNTALLYGGHVSSQSNDIRGVPMASSNRQAYQSDTGMGSRAVNSMASLAVNHEQVKNMKVQQDLMLAQMHQTNASTIKTMADTKMTDTQREQLEAAFEDVLKGIRLTNQRTDTEIGRNLAETQRTEAETERTKLATQIAENQEYRAKLQASADLAKTWKEIANLELDRKRKEFENSLQPEQKEKLKQEILILESTQSQAYTKAEMDNLEKKVFEKYGLTRSDPYWAKSLAWEMMNAAQRNQEKR